MRLILWVRTFFLIVFLFGCEKEDLDIEEGVYKGKFTVIYSSGPQTGETTLELKDGRFSCSGNSDKIPAGGSGTYSFNDGKITFNDENYWTADFDWNLISHGRYSYTLDGKRLKISAEKKGFGQYIYDLEKE